MRVVPGFDGLGDVGGDGGAQIGRQAAGGGQQMLIERVAQGRIALQPLADGAQPAFHVVGDGGIFTRQVLLQQLLDVAPQ